MASSITFNKDKKGLHTYDRSSLSKPFNAFSKITVKNGNVYIDSSLGYSGYSSLGKGSDVILSEITLRRP